MNVIIGIHGLGNKPSKDLLEEWWRLAMLEGLRNNKYNSVLPKFELVYWADILHERPLNESEPDLESGEYLDEPYVKASKQFQHESHDTRKKIVDFLGRQINKIFLNDDLSLNYSSLTEAILRRYFNDLDVYFAQNCSEENDEDCKAKELINERLKLVLQKYRNYDIMLISHSMGSIIAYEILNFDAPEIKINTLITIGSPLGLPVVISKIAAEQKNEIKDQNHLKTPPSVQKHWYNFSDILDNVAFNYRLADDFDENDLGIRPIDFQVINNYEVNGKRNPHKSFGYLRTPEFSKVLNEFILNEKLSVSQKIIRKVFQVFRQ